MKIYVTWYNDLPFDSTAGKRSKLIDTASAWNQMYLFMISKQSFPEIIGLGIFFHTVLASFSRNLKLQNTKSYDSEPLAIYNLNFEDTEVV